MPVPDPETPRRYLKGTERDQTAWSLRRDYEVGGLTAAELADRHCISRTTVQRLLAEAGTRMRPAAARPPRPANKADLDRLVAGWLADADQGAAGPVLPPPASAPACPVP